MAESQNDMDALGQKRVADNRKLSLNDWIIRYKVNFTALAERLGITRQQLYNIRNGYCNASLSIGLSIFYESGGLVSMFSMVLEGDALREDLKELIRLTNTQNRAKINRFNTLKRYNIRKL